MRRTAMIGAMVATALMGSTRAAEPDDEDFTKTMPRPPERPDSYHPRYQKRVEEYVAWRKASRYGRVQTFVSEAKQEARKAAGRALLDRQAAREKSGFYDGTMALANVLGQRFGRMRRQKGDNGGLVRLR